MRSLDADSGATNLGGPMKQVEYWRWRYWDPETRRICRTMCQLTAEEAAKYQDAVRIKGSKLLREVEDDSVDIAQGIFPPQIQGRDSEMDRGH